MCSHCHRKGKGKEGGSFGRICKVFAETGKGRGTPNAFLCNVAHRGGRGEKKRDPGRNHEERYSVPPMEGGKARWEIAMLLSVGGDGGRGREEDRSLRSGTVLLKEERRSKERDFLHHTFAYRQNKRRGGNPPVTSSLNAKKKGRDFTTTIL